MKAVVAKLVKISKQDLVWAISVFTIGFLMAFTANAAPAKPSQADWEAWGKLKPVKKFDYNKVYDSIDADLARLEVKESHFAQELPIQAAGPMHAISKSQYRGSNSRVR